MPVILHTQKSKQQLFSALAEGIRSPFDAVGYTFRQKGFWPILLVLFLINGAIFCTAIYLVFTRLYPILKTFAPSADVWYMVVVRMVSGSVITLVTLFAAIIMYAFAGSLISSPLLDALSAGTEKRLSGEKLKAPSIVYPFSEIFRIFLTFLRGLAGVAVAVVALFPLNLVPIAGNLLYSIFTLAAIGFFTGSPFYSYPLDRRSISAGSKMGLLWRYRWTVIGGGIGFLIISFVPIMGFLSHGFASVGAATIFREKILPFIEISYTSDEQ